MLKPALVFVAATALALPATAMAEPQINIAPAGPVVELSIYESVSLAPDQATIGAGVTTEAPKATEAMRQNAENMTNVIARIKAQGIAEKDIQTTGISLGAQYDYNEPAYPATTMPSQVFRAYQASNRVSVVLHKIEDTGRVLDALIEAGATDISGPDFGVENDAAAKEQARSRAVARGEAQATAYAKMLGYTGVKVLAVSESVETAFPVYDVAKMVAELAPTATPVQPGMISSGVSVTITYELTGKAN